MDLDEFLRKLRQHAMKDVGVQRPNRRAAREAKRAQRMSMYPYGSNRRARERREREALEEASRHVVDRLDGADE
jgi:hypothetical protein